jgi:hypothetical protein
MEAPLFGLPESLVREQAQYQREDRGDGSLQPSPVASVTRHAGPVLKRHSAGATKGKRLGA